MADIIDTEEVDKDTVEPDDLEQQFSKSYQLLSEKAVSLKKSYINKLNGTKSLKLAFSLSDKTIEVYQLSGSSLNRICCLSGHSKAVTDVVFSPKEEHLVYSSGQDGFIKLWDTRTSGSCVQEYVEGNDKVSRPYECLDVSCNARVLCAGTQLVKDDAFLMFWDQRMNKALGGYWNSHTDDITQVRFHREKSDSLATGSVDGLLNVFNITEQSEDEALLYSLNVENSVEKLSWLDDRSISCVTQSNELQLWDAESGDLLKSYSRDKVAKGIKRSRPDDCYLVDAFTSTDDTQVFLAGSNAGDGHCLRSVSITEKRLQPRTDYSQNKQIVRCCWYNRERDLLVTAGESGILSVWVRGEGEAATGPPTTKLVNTMNKLRVNRHKPY